MNTLMDNVSIVGFNTQGMKSNSMYVNSLLIDNDIIFLNEHWLSNAEKHILENMCKHSHTIMFNPAEKKPCGRPYQGNCFLINHALANQVETIHKDNRVFAIKVASQSNPLLLIGVYLTSYHNADSIDEYREQLNLIASLICMNAECEPIVIGDHQSFPDSIYDSSSRNNPKRNPLSKLLSNFLTNNNMDLADVTMGHGPSTTYRHPTLANSSYIDHVAVRKDTKLNITDCFVSDQIEINISDHCPVSISVTTDLTIDEIISQELPKSYIPSRYWKNDTFKRNYHLAIEKNVLQLSQVDVSDESILKMFDILQDSATEAAETTFKHESKVSFSRKWWTPALTNAKRILSSHFKSWKEAGFPRDEGTIHCRYLLARKNFRKHVKYAQNKLLVKKYMAVDKLKNTHPQNFWNKMRSVKNTVTKTRYTVNGKQTDEEISNEFADHFSTLLNQPRVRINPPPVCTLDPSKLSSEQSITISSIEIEKIFKLLKLGKAVDPFGIVAEHFIFAENDMIKSWLLNLFNEIFDKGETSALLSTSKMIPLVKSLKKSLRNAGNYRGISIIPILTKMLEYIILLKCPELSQTHKLQFGFDSCSSTLHAEFMISETIKYYNSKKSPIYMCSLDAEKAFDSCNWDVLFNKLIERDVSLRIVNILSSLYVKGTSRVSYNGILSDVFSLSQGVRQGSILSPYLYNIYTELLLETIEMNSKVGSSLFGVFTGIVMYADDIILLSPTKSGLQELLDKCLCYSDNHGIRMNADKTEFVVSAPNKTSNEHIILNHWFVYPNTSLKHLGFLWNIRKDNSATVEGENITQRVNKFWTVIYALIKAGIRYCAPHTIAHMFRSLAIPTLTYGLELCDLKPQLLAKLDTEARSALKSLFDLSKYSKNYLQPLFNIESISRTLQRNKLGLCARLLSNETTRHVLLNLLSTQSRYHSFAADISDVSRSMNYDLREIIFNGNSVHIDKEYPTISPCVKKQLDFCVKYWHIQPLRHKFKQVLEERVVRPQI